MPCSGRLLAPGYRTRLAVALVVGLGTAIAVGPACRSPSAQNAVDGSAAPATPEQRGEGVEERMIETIQSLCQRLSGGPITVEDLADDLGTVTQRFEEGRRLAVQPTDPSLEAARLAGDPETGTPRSIRLTARQPYQTTVSDLTAAFGDFTVVPRRHPDDLLSVRFEVELPQDGAGRCLVFATVAGTELSPGTGIEDNPVSGVSLRHRAR